MNQFKSEKEINYWKKETDRLGKKVKQILNGDCGNCGHQPDYGECEVCLGYIHQQS
jgi:hypothetical protein